MKTRTSIILSLIIATILAFATVMTALAATPIYVRPGGDDALCNGTADVDYPGSGGPGLACSVKTIQKGIDLVDVGGTVNVAAGTYDQDLTINKSLSLLGAGAGSTTIRGVIGGGSATIQVGGSNITIAGFTITRLGNTLAEWDLALNMAGIAVQGTANTGMVVRDNILTGNRTGIDINNSSSHTIRNNIITDNRTGMVLRNQTDNLTVVENEITNNWTAGIVFLDASVGTNSPMQTALNCTFSNNNLSGNWYGQIVDRQTGGSLPLPGANLKNFSANWWGTTTPVVSTANSTEPGYSAQIPVAYGGTAVAPGGMPDILGPASANFDFTPYLNSGTDTNIETTSGRGTYGFQGDFSNLWVAAAGAQTGATSRVQEGINTVSGSMVNVLAGTYVENLRVNKSVILAGSGAASTTIIPVVSLPNPCTGSSLCGSPTAASNVILVEANNVVVHDLTVDGDNPALTSAYNLGGANVDARNGIIKNTDATYNNLEVYNVTVKNIYLRGIYSTGGSFNFHNNTVTNVQGDGYSIAMFAWYGPGTMANNTVSYANDAISANHSNGIQFLNNTVSNSGSGIHTDNSGDGGGIADLIQGNNVVCTGTPGAYGIWVFVPYLAPTVNNNTVTNCDVGLSAWGTGAAVTTQFTNNTVIGNLATGGVGAYVTTSMAGYGYSDVSANFSGNRITGYETGVFLDANQTTWDPLPYVAKTINATFYLNQINGNTKGVDKGTTGTYVTDFERNWWGAASGPSGVGPGSGDSIVAGIDYQPWCANAACTVFTSGGTISIPPTMLAADVQTIISTAAPSTTLIFEPGIFVTPAGGYVVTQPRLTFQLSVGTIIQPSSPCFTVLANDTTLIGGVCVPSSGSDGILTGAALNNFVIKNMEIRNSTGTGDGIHLGHNITNLQIVDNYIHNMGGDGIEYASGTTVSGVHEVQGNLFQLNGGAGINNASGKSYIVEYNSWNDIAGPTGPNGDGAAGPLDYTPWTHVGLSMISSGSPVPNKVAVGAQIVYTIYMDAAEVFGADFDLKYDSTKLSVVSATNGGAFTQGSLCTIDTATPGVISFCGSRISALNGTAQPMFQVTFQGVAAGVAPLNLDETSDSFGMVPPAGASTNIYAAALTDGSVEVFDTFNVTGRIDLQGRANDSGAVMTFAVGTNQGYGPYAFGASDYWGSISRTGVTADTYNITVSMPRYLPVTIASSRGVAISADRVLSTLTLLGGDADNSGAIGLGDATIIGGLYGTAGDSAGDINADSVINILDLALMGGNYGKTSETAYASWTP